MIFLGLIEITKAEEVVLRNPFESWFYIRSKEEEKLREKEKITEVEGEKPRPIELNLKGILTGKRNLAIINDEILGEGEVIEGKKIVRIEKKKVVLKDLGEDKEIILELPDEL